MSIVIVSRVEGRHRGGTRHPLGARSYEIGAFTMAQLHEIAADPVMTVVRGVLITPENLGTLLAEGAEVQKAPELPASPEDDVPPGAAEGDESLASSDGAPRKRGRQAKSAEG